MTTTTFDSLAYVKKLEDGGFTRRQAETQAEAQTIALCQVIDDRLASKSDFVQLEDKIVAMNDKLVIMSGRLDRIETEMQRIELRLTVKIAAMITGAVALISVIQKIF